jgi:hypothetical protein
MLGPDLFSIFVNQPYIILLYFVLWAQFHLASVAPLSGHSLIKHYKY